MGRINVTTPEMFAIHNCLQKLFLGNIIAKLNSSAITIITNGCPAGRAGETGVGVYVGKNV